MAVCGVVRAQIHSRRDQIHGVSNVCGSNAAFVLGCLECRWVWIFEMRHVFTCFQYDCQTTNFQHGFAEKKKKLGPLAAPATPGLTREARSGPLREIIRKFRNV